MEDGRKEIIIKEIRYWKQHKLLPERYCDFLLALYTNGEEAKNHEVEQKRSLRRLVFVAQILFLAILVPFSFVVIYFTKFNSIMQISMLAIFLLFSLTMYRHMKKSGHLLGHLALADTLIIGLLLSVFISNTYIHFNWAQEAAILLNSLVWIFYGQSRKLAYLKVAGILGLAFMAVYNVL